MLMTAIHNGNRNPPMHCEAGIGLIEVLITLFILAIGLLGIAGTQFMSKRASYESVQRTTATFLANDIIERMRANSNVLFNYVNGDTPWGGGTITTVPPVPAANNAIAIALYDLYEWEQAIDGVAEIAGTVAAGTPTGGLVFPSACVYTTVPVASTSQTGQYMVAIVWRGSAKLSDPVNPNLPPAPAPDPYECGRTSGNYNSEGSTTDNAHRRILIVNTYIAQN